MKTINVTFEDSEYQLIEDLKKKEGRSWHDFILYMAKDKLFAREE